MGLWVSFAFGALLGVFLGVLIGRARAAARGQGARAPSEGHAPTATPMTPPRSLPPEIQHVVLDEGSANVLNALNNRLAAIGALADLLHGSPLDPERARPLMRLHGEVRRLRDSQPPRELRIAVSESGPSLSISLWDSGTPLSVEAEQRLVTPFRFTQSAGGGEIEFALARALAQSSGGTLRLRPRTGGGAGGVGTLPHSVLAPLARATPSMPTLPKLRILVVDDDAVNRQAMRLLLEREGHEVVAVEN